MITLLSALVLMVCTSYWRWHDGRDAGVRWEHSSSYTIPLVLIACAVAYGMPTWDPIYAGAILACGVLTWRLLLKGFAGWDQWKYMLTTRALPTALAGGAFALYFHSWTALVFALSGLGVAAAYVLSNKFVESYMAKNDRNLPYIYGKIHWGYAGEISHGLFVLGLALL